GDLNSCKACHGDDYKGTILSRSHADRTINTGDLGTKTFWRGRQIGCFTCHNGPNDEDNPNPIDPPEVTSATASTTANTPKTIALIATKGTIRIVSQPQNGTVGLSGSTATYYPFFNFTGTDAFTFAAWHDASGQDSNLATGTVTVSEGSCVLVCAAVVPPQAGSRNPVPFWAQATVSNCAAAVSYAWNFGDGSTSTDALSQYAYPTNGTYGWRLVVSGAGQACTNSGSIVISDVQIDMDEDGIEDDWEGINFGSLVVANGTTDFDHDGLTDLAESLAGTGPKDPLSRLVITELTPPAGSAVVKWTSQANRSYRVSATTSLVSTAFAPIAEHQAATPPENSITDPSAAGQPKKFYRIELE
ncbi:MAG: hypothetical protein K9M45_10290, partial [Kiritimatiellales bacterium]|nr:hypothetical protein [Kiritimatiellales bacterium]